MITREQFLSLQPPASLEPPGSVIAQNNMIPVIDRLRLLAQNDIYNQSFTTLADNNKEELTRTSTPCNATLLHEAAFFGATQNLRTLLFHLQTYPDKQRLLAQRDCFGQTALHCALTKNNLCAVELLLRAGAPITWVKRSKKRIRSAVHVALDDVPPPTTKKGKHKYYKQEFAKKRKILWLLYAYGANFNAKNKKFRTPLTIAQRKPILNQLVPFIKNLKSFSAFKESHTRVTHYPPQDMPTDIIGLIANFVTELDTQPKPNEY